MASKWTLVLVLENEAERRAIEDIFKRIDEATKTFEVNLNLIQLDIAWTTERQVNIILSEIKVNIKIFY